MVREFPRQFCCRRTASRQPVSKPETGSFRGQRRLPTPTITTTPATRRRQVVWLTGRRSRHADRWSRFVAVGRKRHVAATAPGYHFDVIAGKNFKHIWLSSGQLPWPYALARAICAGWPTDPVKQSTVCCLFYYEWDRSGNLLPRTNGVRDFAKAPCRDGIAPGAAPPARQI
jgi:hypothetical protein